MLYVPGSIYWVLYSKPHAHGGLNMSNSIVVINPKRDTQRQIKALRDAGLKVVKDSKAHKVKKVIQDLKAHKVLKVL